jgi:hypothetical protein
MSKHRSNIIFKDLATGIFLIYLFYALTILFIIPNTTSNAKISFVPGISARRQTLNTYHESLNLIIAGEKPIMDEDQINLIKSIPAFFLVLFIGLSFLRIRNPLTVASKVSFYNLRHSYLSFCTLRI